MDAHPDSDLVARAEAIARRAHAGQFRRDGVTPYLAHVAAVAERVRGDSAAEAVAWLHDVIEDTSETAETLVAQGIPEAIVATVRRLTHTEAISYERYLAAIKDDPVARRVKTADMISNLADRPTAKQILKYARGLLTLHE